jgi:hypothetical protein
LIGPESRLLTLHLISLDGDSSAPSHHYTSPERHHGAGLVYLRCSRLPPTAADAAAFFKRCDQHLKINNFSGAFIKHEGIFHLYATRRTAQTAKIKEY